MKVGLVCPYHLKSFGGVQRQVLEWSQCLQKLGHRSKILTCGPEIDLGREDIVFFGNNLPVPANEDTGTLSIYPWNGKALKQFLAQENFDLLHFHEPFIPFLSWQLLRASKTTNVATFHSFPEASLVLRVLGRPAKALILPSLKERIKRFSAVSLVAVAFVQDLVGELEIIPNAIDVQRFAVKEKIDKFCDGKVNLLYVGRLSKRKGVLYLLRSLKKIKENFDRFRLIIVGTGPEEEEIKEFVKDSHFENVVFAGRVSNEDLPAYYQTADVFCAPAIQGESFGIVLLEAMAAGLPIVAFANAGYKEILRNGPFSEFLVEPKDTAGFAWQLKRLIADKNLRTKLGQASLKEAEKYSWEAVGKKILEFYKKAIDE
jgi:phosphatidylinositol alpha-mannosyltransferase